MWLKNNNILKKLDKIIFFKTSFLKTNENKTRKLLEDVTIKETGI